LLPLGHIQHFLQSICLEEIVGIKQCDPVAPGLVNAAIARLGRLSVLRVLRDLGTMAICKESGKTKKTVWRLQERYAEEGI
jgi:dihydroxyacid dehydratase/phosphogluconate dehydratase